MGYFFILISERLTLYAFIMHKFIIVLPLESVI